MENRGEINVSTALTSIEPETSKYSWSRYLNISTQTPPSRRHQRPSMQVDSAEDGDDDDDDDDDDEDNDVDDNSDGKDNENDNLIESDEEGEATTHFGGSACSGSGSVGADVYKPHASTSDAAKARDRHADRAAKFSSI